MNWLEGAYSAAVPALALIALLAGPLAVSAEASTRVADTLDQVLRDSGKLKESRAAGSSRRYLLAQAREALEQGEALNLVAERLRLSRDEVQLLRLVRSAAAAA